MALMQPEQHADVHRLLEYCYEQVRRYALAQAAAGADFTAIGDSTAGPDVCSPRIYRQFAHPYEVRLAADMAAHGVRLVIHICGNTTAIMADIATTGATMIEFDYKADMARSRRAAAQNITLVGNVDPSGVMALGTPEEVLEECRRASRFWVSTGASSSSPGCTLPATTPPENVEAMMEGRAHVRAVPGEPTMNQRENLLRAGALRNAGCHPDGVPHQPGVLAALSARTRCRSWWLHIRCSSRISPRLTGFARPFRPCSGGDEPYRIRGAACGTPPRTASPAPSPSIRWPTGPRTAAYTSPDPDRTDGLWPVNWAQVG